MQCIRSSHVQCMVNVYTTCQICTFLSASDSICRYSCSCMLFLQLHVLWLYRGSRSGMGYIYTYTHGQLHGSTPGAALAPASWMHAYDHDVSSSAGQYSLREYIYCCLWHLRAFRTRSYKLYNYKLKFVYRGFPGV